MPTETSFRGQSADAGCPLFFAEKLTADELATLSLAAQGYTAQEIAARLFIAEVTAKKRLQVIRETLGARNTTHAVMIAGALGLITFDTVQVN